MIPASLQDYLETTVNELRLEQHPYFHSLLNESISKQSFIESQRHFARMVQYFSRPMASVIANIPDPITRSALVANLWEEHGQGDPIRIHGQTIVTLIDRLGGDIELPLADNVLPVVDIFNSALKGIATHEDYRVSAAVFGGIERTFVDVSALICEAIIKHGWLEEPEITHYSLHKELDIQHAKEFLEVVSDDWNRDEASRAMIERGIRLGARLFTSVYSEFAQYYANGQL